MQKSMVCQKRKSDQSIDLAFSERGLDPMDWCDFPAGATLKTQITLYGKTALIDVGLLSEAFLLENQAFIPAVI
jgi:hypothetical protein